MKIPRIHHFSDWPGTSRTQTILLLLPWMLVKLSFLMFVFHVLQWQDSITIEHVSMELHGLHIAHATFVQLVRLSLNYKEK